MHIGLSAQIDIIGVFSVSGQEPDVFAPLAAGTNSAIFWHVISSLAGTVMLHHSPAAFRENTPPVCPARMVLVNRFTQRQSH
jgi:hypothetical protein